MPETSDSDDADVTETTDSTDERWIGLSTAITSLYAASLPILVGAHTTGIVDVGTLPQTWFLVYAGSTMTATDYALGQPVGKAIGQLAGK